MWTPQQPLLLSAMQWFEEANPSWSLPLQSFLGPLMRYFTWCLVAKSQWWRLWCWWLQKGLLCSFMCTYLPNERFVPDCGCGRLKHNLLPSMTSDLSPSRHYLILKARQLGSNSLGNNQSGSLCPKGASERFAQFELRTGSRLSSQPPFPCIYWFRLSYHGIRILALVNAWPQGCGPDLLLQQRFGFLGCGGMPLFHSKDHVCI